MTHKYVSELGQHLFRQRVLACSVLSHQLNKCCEVNWNLMDDSWLVNRYTVETDYTLLTHLQYEAIDI